MKRFLPFFLLFVALAGLAATFRHFTTRPGDAEEPFSFPAFAIRDGGGALTVIDQSQRRVLRTSYDGTLRFQLQGGSRDPSEFFYTQEVAVVDVLGRLFLLNQVLDKQGFFLVREEIQMYDHLGNFLETIHRVELDEKPHRMVQRCWTRSLKGSEYVLKWFELRPEGIVPFHYSGAKVESAPMFPVPNAHLEVADVDWLNRNEIVYSLKSGKILRQARDSAPTVLYDADNTSRPRKNGAPPVPWELEVDDETVYFVDLPNREICRIEPDGGVSTVYTASRGDIYRLSSHAGVLTSCCGNTVYSVDGRTGDIVAETDHVRLSTFQRGLRFAFWGFGLLAFVSLGFCTRILYVDVFHRRPPRGLMQALGVLLVIAVTLTASLPLILGRMIDRQQTLLLDRLNQMIHTIPMLIDADRIDRLDTAASYQSENYRELRRQLYETYNENRDSWNAGWYFVLYRVYENRVFGLMYRNELIGPYYPFTWGEETDADYIRAMNEGTVRTAIQRDGMGTWIYGIAPIRNSRGEIVAVFETGTDLYAMTLENRKLIVEVLLDSLTMLIVIVLCMFEFLFFLNLRSVRANLVQKPAGSHSETFLTRPCVFLFFSAISFPVAFIPLVMKSLYEPIPGFSEEMILAAPISVQMLCFGLGTLLAGWAVSAWGVRPILQTGFLFTGLGLLCGAAAQNMQLFLAATAFLGLGTGIGFIGIRSVLLLEPNQELRDQGYSYFYAGMTAGVNVGLVFGAGLADRIGFHQVFAAALAVLAVAWMFNTVYLPASTALARTRAPSTGINLFRFLRNPLVLAFLLLHVIPVYAIAAYIYYFFPIFAASEGVGTGNIGRLLILNGLMIIYVGPVLGPFLLRKFSGRTAFMLGQVTWAIGTAVIFACFPTVSGAVVVLILFGVAEGVVAAGDMSYYLQLDAVKKFGEERAIAVFELVGKVGETIGPILFAFVLGFGLRTGMVLLGGGCALTLLSLILINFVAQRRSSIDR